MDISENEIKKSLERAKQILSQMSPEEKAELKKTLHENIETGCIRCGTKESEAFYFEEEGFICEECSSKDSEM